MVSPGASERTRDLTVFVFQVVNDKEEASVIAIEGIDMLVRHLDRWKILAAIFPREERIRSALVELYTNFLDFLVWGARHLGANPMSARFPCDIGALYWQLDLTQM